MRSKSPKGSKLQWSSTDLRDLKERCNTQSREQGLHVPEKGKTFEGAEREETVAWKKDTYQLLKQAEQGKVKSYVQEIALAVLDCKETGCKSGYGTSTSFNPGKCGSYEQG